jgi:hypothetical protein
MSLHQNNKLLLLHDKRCFVSHWPPASEIGMLLITNFPELRVVAGRNRTRAGRPHAVSGRPMLIHTHHAVPLPRPCRGLERWLSERHGNGMAYVNQIRPHCVNQMGKTHFKPLAERHGMYESALSVAVGSGSEITGQDYISVGD